MRKEINPESFIWFRQNLYYSLCISFRFIRKWRPRQCFFPEIQNSRYVNLKIDYYWQKIVFPWRECVNGKRVAKRETIARVSILVRLDTARNRFLFRAILRERVTLLSVSACLTLTDDTLLGALRRKFPLVATNFVRLYCLWVWCGTLIIFLLKKIFKKVPYACVRSSSFSFFFLFFWR